LLLMLSFVMLKLHYSAALSNWPSRHYPYLIKQSHFVDYVKDCMFPVPLQPKESFAPMRTTLVPAARECVPIHNCYVMALISVIALFVPRDIVYRVVPVFFNYSSCTLAMSVNKVVEDIATWRGYT
jgi:hypothetical protein